MTSVTARGFHEPSLLFDEAGSGLRRAWRDLIVPGAAEQRDRPVGIEPAQFVAAQLFHGFAGFAPGLHPSFALGDLFGRPIGEA